MKYNIYLLCIFLNFPILLNAQQQILVAGKTYPGDFKQFAVDNLGNQYFLQKNDQFKKVNPQGDSMGVFNDVRRFGKLSSINTQNPLRTILFYKDFRNIVILDRFLHIVNAIDLKKQNLFQVNVIAPSFDNNIWIFDEQESKLKKIGEDGKKIIETADLRTILGEAITPEYLFDQNGFVYVFDSHKGMYIFDYYGALKSKIALLGWKDVVVSSNIIFGIKDSALMSYATGSLQIKTIPLPKEATQSLKMVTNAAFFYFLTPNAILQYTLTKHE